MSLQQTQTSRIQSIDFIRGLVMVLMAIDHVRVYSGLPAGGPEPGIFLTRWVTHFCAPAFVFLSGTSAYFYGKQLNDVRKLSRYLFTRGFLLIVLELTVIRFFWTFNLQLSEFMLAGVIWMLGWCMVLMGLLVRLNAKTIGIIGLAIIFLQNIFSYVPNLLPQDMRVGFGRVWEFIYSSGLEGPPGVTILYVIIPWIGVMMAGYGFGLLLQGDALKRKKQLFYLGLGATVTFIVAALVFALQNPSGDMPLFFQVLNQRKYPASQLYLLMTLGPAIALMPFVEQGKSFLAKAIVTIGRVPFFYYLLHILLIHLSALVVQLILFGQTFTDAYATAPYTWMEETYRWNLPVLYVVFAIDVVLLYIACRWYEAYKFQHPEKKWLKFV